MDGLPASLAERFAKAGTPMAVLEARRVVWANASFEHLFGASLGKPISEVVGGVASTFFDGAITRTGPRVARMERKKGPRTFSYDVEVIHAGGSIGVLVRDETRVLERELIVSTFAKKVERANRKLEARNEVMRTLLDHAEDGFFVLDARGRILPEMAAVLPRLVGHDPTGETLAELLPGENGAAVAELLGLALAGTIPESLLHESLDYDWTVGDRTLRLALSILSESVSEGPTRVLGKLSDVTAERKEKEAQQARAEYQALVTAAVHHPEHFVVARGEISAFADRLRNAEGDATSDERRQQLLISVHTVKATTRAYQMEATTAKLHGLEARLAAGDDSVQDDVRASVLALDGLFGDVAKLLDSADVECTSVDRRALGALTNEVARLEGGEPVARGLRTLLLHPLAGELDGLQRVAAGTAADRGKAVRVELDVGNLRVDRARLQSLLAALPHLVRNAVAHGIEGPDARLDAGKPAQGCIRLVAALSAPDGRLRLSVEDDGAGVDRERLAEHLRDRGMSMPLATDADVLAALCLPELSTAATADMHAGRGVGLSAVADEVDTLGGTLSLWTEPGRGTRFAIELPVDIADPIAVLDTLELSQAA